MRNEIDLKLKFLTRQSVVGKKKKNLEKIENIGTTWKTFETLSSTF